MPGRETRVFRPGRQLEFCYPTTRNVKRMPDAPRRRRELRIEAVRDLLNEPLTASEFLQFPYLNRSRWLASGIDETIGEHRSFYLGSSDEYASPGVLRLVTWCNEEKKITDIICREFYPTISDRKLMIRLLKRWDEIPHGDEELRVTSCDMRILT